MAPGELATVAPRTAHPASGFWAGFGVVVGLLAAAPFGWISGWLSGMDRAYPFWLTAALLLVGLALVGARWVPVHAGEHEHARAEVV